MCHVLVLLLIKIYKRYIKYLLWKSSCTSYLAFTRRVTRDEQKRGELIQSMLKTPVPAFTAFRKQWARSEIQDPCSANDDPSKPLKGWGYYSLRHIKLNHNFYMNVIIFTARLQWIQWKNNPHIWVTSAGLKKKGKEK